MELSQILKDDAVKLYTQYASKFGKLSSGHGTGKGQFSFQSQRKALSNHLTCLLRNLYAGQEAIVKTGHETTDGFQIGKGVLQGCILSPCLFNLDAEYIRRNTGLEEAQAGIRFARKNIVNFRYADDITLLTESEEKLKSLLMKLREKNENLA